MQIDWASLGYRLRPERGVWIRMLALLFKNKNRRTKSSFLFNGDDALFKHVLSKTQVYGEYGCGQSTNWVLDNTRVKVFSVDSSKYWVDKVLFKAPSSNRLNIKHIELGEVAEWGYPIGYHHGDRFYQYTDWIWRQTAKPTTVLIDGRFRVCCFLTSLKYAEEGVQILFDDYANRPCYHIVEKYIKPTEQCGRHCLFVVPKACDIDFQALEQDIANFRYVMD